MKKLVMKAALLAVVCMTAVTFTACNDDDDKSTKLEVASELVGSYTPTWIAPTTDDFDPEAQIYLEINPTWTDPENIPTIDLSAIFGSEDPYLMPMNTVCSMISGIATVFVSNGLVQIDLNKDGSFGAKYHGMIIGEDEDIMTTIFSPTFDTAVSTFPSADTDEVLPSSALNIFTKDNQIFFSVSKKFLKSVEQEDGVEIISTIDNLLDAYPTLGLVSTKSYYAIPLKYTLSDAGVLRIYVDREMMLPYIKVLTDMLGGMLDPDDLMGLDPAVILSDLFNNTTDLQIAIYLKKM